MNDKIKVVSDASFEADVVNSSQPVLVDFWAEWCGPCKMISPIVEEIAGDYNGKLKVGKVNVDFNQQTAMTYGIRGIPALLVFNSGAVANQIVGAVPKDHITEILDEVIK